MRTSRIDRRLIGGIVVGVVSFVLAALVGPQRPQLSGRVTGDGDLARAVRVAVGPDPAGYRGLSVALVEGDRVRFAGLGESGNPAHPAVRPATPFEIGSIGKVLTGMLLAELARDGVVTPELRLAEVLPATRFADPTVADVTLAELASHRAGMPRLEPGPVRDLLRRSLAALRAGNPYAGLDDGSVLAGAGVVRSTGERGTPHYSNFGMALLGHVLAARAATAYPQLLRQRILDPIGMSATTFQVDGTEAPTGHATGSTAAGRPAAPWTGSGYLPAGIGIWSTAEDLARLLRAVLDTSAPGAQAAEPRFDGGNGGRVGYGWFTSKLGGKELTWHDGGTGGFRSFVGVDRAARRAVVVLGNTTRDVHPIGHRLLGADDTDDSAGGAGPTSLLLTTLLLLAGGLLTWSLALRPVEGRWWRPAPDRLAVVAAGGTSVAVLAVAYLAGAWLDLPSLLWAAGVAFAATGLLLAGLRWAALPTARGPWPGLRYFSTVTSLGGSALVTAAVMLW